MYNIHIQQAGYVQSKPIIDDIAFTLPASSIIGLIGGNGAGKSTTIQAMLQTLPYATVTHNIPEQLGYVPERPILYEYATLREHIHLLIQLLQGDEAALWQRALDLCETFKLGDKLDDYPIQFSKGMQQKVMLVLAFTPTYAFYIVDEPFMGLDPQAIRALLQLLRNCRDEGATILMSTHALDTAERLCDTFLCVHEGALIADGTLRSLQQHEDDTLLDVFDALIERADVMKR